MAIMYYYTPVPMECENYLKTDVTIEAHRTNSPEYATGRYQLYVASTDGFEQLGMVTSRKFEFGKHYRFIILQPE